MEPIKPLNLPFLQEASCGSGALNDVSCALNDPPPATDTVKLSFPTLAGCQNSPLVRSLTPKASDKVEEAVAQFRRSAQSSNQLVRTAGALKLEEKLLNEFTRPGFCGDKHLYAKKALLDAKAETEARMQRAVGPDKGLYAHAVSVLNAVIKERKD